MVESGAMPDSDRIIPPITEELRPFFEGARNRQLVVQKCERCAKVRFPPAPICPECLSHDLRWTAVSGRGRVFSYSVMHRAYHPAFANKVPYALVVIELEEGGKINSNVVGIEPHRLRCGMAVEVTFEQVSDEVVLPKFKPVAV
jgi:uncharacterized OB-fold protein